MVGGGRSQATYQVNAKSRCEVIISIREEEEQANIMTFVGYGRWTSTGDGILRAIDGGATRGPTRPG